MECQGGVVVDDRRPPQPIGCRVGCRENRPLRPSTKLYISLTVSRVVCRALQAVTPLQLYSSTALYTLQPLHPPSWYNARCGSLLLGGAGASRPLVRVLRVVHVVLGVRRWLGPRG